MFTGVKKGFLNVIVGESKRCDEEVDTKQKLVSTLRLFLVHSPNFSIGHMRHHTHSGPRKLDQWVLSCEKFPNLNTTYVLSDDMCRMLMQTLVDMRSFDGTNPTQQVITRLTRTDKIKKLL